MAPSADGCPRAPVPEDSGCFSSRPPALDLRPTAVSFAVPGKRTSEGDVAEGLGRRTGADRGAPEADPQGRPQHSPLSGALAFCGRRPGLGAGEARVVGTYSPRARPRWAGPGGDGVGPASVCRGRSATRSGPVASFGEKSVCPQPGEARNIPGRKPAADHGLGAAAGPDACLVAPRAAEPGSERRDEEAAPRASHSRLRVNGRFLCGLPSPAPKDACGEGACLFLGCPGVLCPEDRPSSKGPAQRTLALRERPERLRPREVDGAAPGGRVVVCSPGPSSTAGARPQQGRGRVGLLHPPSGTGDPGGPRGSRVVTASGRDSGAAGRGHQPGTHCSPKREWAERPTAGPTGQAGASPGTLWDGRRRGAGSGRLTALPSAAWTPENSPPAAPRLDAQDSGGPQAGPAEGRLPGRLVAVSPPGLCSCGERRLASLTLVRTAALRTTEPLRAPPAGRARSPPAVGAWAFLRPALLCSVTRARTCDPNAVLVTLPAQECGVTPPPASGRVGALGVGSSPGTHQPRGPAPPQDSPMSTPNPGRERGGGPAARAQPQLPPRSWASPSPSLDGARPRPQEAAAGCGEALAPGASPASAPSAQVLPPGPERRVPRGPGAATVRRPEGSGHAVRAAADLLARVCGWPRAAPAGVAQNPRPEPGLGRSGEERGQRGRARTPPRLPLPASHTPAASLPGGSLRPLLGQKSLFPNPSPPPHPSQSLPLPPRLPPPTPSLPPSPHSSPGDGFSLSESRSDPSPRVLGLDGGKTETWTHRGGRGGGRSQRRETGEGRRALTTGVWTPGSTAGFPRSLPPQARSRPLRYPDCGSAWAPVPRVPNRDEGGPGSLRVAAGTCPRQGQTRRGTEEACRRLWRRGNKRRP
ncbi:collagen alpha-1(I) chain-like [Vulpes lagopus]|uniref:collagen alpha-1(I) chain-like n=1 Tax=Vulpes lagopus TaxID=494514 RepID=UPI001BC95115|nr:collagen alpha-1(I) chain-like [Vulpes lagopus]